MKNEPKLLVEFDLGRTPSEIEKPFLGSETCLDFDSSLLASSCVSELQFLFASFLTSELEQPALPTQESDLTERALRVI